MPNPFDQFDQASGPIYGPPPVAPKPPGPPSGYRGDNEGLAFIPGGPADPYRAGGELDPHKADKPKEPLHIPPAAASGIQSNIESLRALDSAIQSLHGRPESIGPGTGMLGDTFTQFNDPAGTDVRSRVGNIGAIKIHDLSGAAVSPTEAPRFQPFVPTITDRPEVAEQKLKQFREALSAQINEQLHYYSQDNGYLPYKTPQADAFQAGQEAAPQGRFGDEFGAAGTQVQFKDDAETRTRAKRFHDDLYNALASKQLRSPEQINQWVAQFNQQNGGGFSVDWQDRETRKAIGAAMRGDKFGVETPQDQTVQQRLETMQQGGGGAGSAAVGGFGDAATVGALPRLGAVADSLQSSLGGDGSFSDNYNANLDANRQYLDTLRSDHPIAYTAGGVAGSIALPTFGARTPGQLALLGAGYGSAYGANQGDSSTSLTDRAANTAEGGLAGLALGFAVPKGIGLIPRRGAGSGAVPNLVDTATGRLNEPLEAAGPAGRVSAARDFGIDLPYGAAGDRTAAIVEKGLDNLPGSAGVMNDARRVTEGQVTNAAEQVASQFGSSRTLSEGGAELQRGAAERIDRGKTVIGKAYDAIPISDAAPATTESSVAALRNLTGRFASNPELAAAMQDGKLATYLTALEKGGLSWKDLKDFRSIIGEKIGDMRFGEGHSTKDLRALYGALSDDMRNTAAATPGGLRAFERANTLNRQNEGVVQGALTRILGKGGDLSPEKAAMAVQAMTKGGKSTGDLRTLAQVKGATVKSGAWDEIAGTLIRMGGQPANSPGRAFDPKVFVNWYSDMAEPARAMLFKPELRQSLDKFVAVNQRLANSNALRNTSQTIPNFIGTGFAGASGAALMTGNVPALLGIGAEAGANFGMAKVWTSPAFVRWATGYSKAAASGSAAAAKSQVGRLSKIAATNPELRDPILSLQRTLLSAGNDNIVPAVAASTNSEPDQNN